MKLSEKIVVLRKQSKLSQEELAEKLCVSRQAVSRWEVGSALPDASNILQLSKLFGVTSDFLLNDDYTSDNDVPVVKNAKAMEKRKTHKIVAFCILASGLFINFTMYILSRIVEVAIPYITYDDMGKKWYHWSSNQVGHSYKYFVQEFDLELLMVLGWGLFIVGLIYIITNSDKIKKFSNK